MLRTNKPSPGVILAYFRLYLHKEKGIPETDKDAQDKAAKTLEKQTETPVKAQEAQDTSKTMSLINGFTQLVSSSYEGAVNTIEGAKQTFGVVTQKVVEVYDNYVSGSAAKLLELDQWLKNTLEPKDHLLAPENWSWEQWVDFMIQLRHKGSEAQAVKQLDGQSRCCEVFFALADYVQMTICACEEGRKAYTKRVLEIRGQIKALENKLKFYETPEGKKEFETQLDFQIDVNWPNWQQQAFMKDLLKKTKDGLNQELDQRILDLAYLGDPIGIKLATHRVNTVTRRGLLDHLLSVERKELKLKTMSYCRQSPYYDPERPYTMQWNFAAIRFTQEKYYMYTEGGWSDFVKTETASSTRARKDEEKLSILEIEKESIKKDSVVIPISELPPPPSTPEDFSLTEIFIVPDYSSENMPNIQPPLVPKPAKSPEETGQEQDEGSIKELTGTNDQTDSIPSSPINSPVMSENPSPNNSVPSSPTEPSQKQVKTPNKGEEKKSVLFFFNSGDKKSKDASNAPPPQITRGLSKSKSSGEQ